jgi:hypothetical protein
MWRDEMRVWRRQTKDTQRAFETTRQSHFIRCHALGLASMYEAHNVTVAVRTKHVT